ncbi:cell division protein FtsB [Bradyrhizobium japonicum]|nr:cell division protein FtsB [Bradyrhizobium japonicum]
MVTKNVDARHNAGHDGWGRDWNAKGEAISTPLTNLPHLPKMVSRARLKSILTGLALYVMAAAIVGYFGVNAYTGKYGLNARQELDQEIIALTSELAQLKRERAKSEQRVSLLRTSRIDPDMLDERARYQLDYVNPHDLVRMIPAK